MPATKTRPRLHNAAVERREASALRYWARDASPGVSRVPRSARSGAAFRTSASRRHTPLVREGKKEAPPGALHGRKTGPPGGGALASIVIPDGSQRDPIRDPGTPASTTVHARTRKGYLGPGSRANGRSAGMTNGGRC